MLHTQPRTKGKQVITIELPIKLIAKAERKAKRRQRTAKYRVTRSLIIREVLERYL